MKRIIITGCGSGLGKCLYESALKKLESIENQFNKSDIEGKRRIIGSIFPKKFQFENKKINKSINNFTKLFN